MSKVKVKLQTGRFDAAMRKLFEFSRRDVAVVMKEQIRGFAGMVGDLTPPNRGARRGTAAKKAGEATLESDIRNSFTPVHPNHSEITGRAMDAVVKANRGGGKRRVKLKANAPKASRGDITKMVKRKKKNVGWLAGAWHSAARKFGSIKGPAWIKRHKGRAKGWSRLRLSSTKAVIDVANAVRFASNVDGLSRRLQWALNAQARKMERRAQYFFDRRAKRSGLK